MSTLTEGFYCDTISWPFKDRCTMVKRIQALEYFCKHLRYANSQGKILFQGYSVAKYSGSSGVAVASTEVCPRLNTGISL